MPIVGISEAFRDTIAEKKEEGKTFRFLCSSTSMHPFFLMKYEVLMVLTI